MSLRHTQVAPGVHRLASVYTNWYVIEEGDRLTVLDGGLPGDWSEFCTVLSRLGHTPGDVDSVLITHHHPDHVGNAQRLRCAGARVFSHPADVPYIRGERHLPIRAHMRFLLHPWYVVYMLRYLAKGITRVPAVVELDTMSDGEVLDVPGSPRVVHAPGHTAGSCALFVEDRSLLFSGDALVTQDVTRGRQKGPQVVRGPVTQDAGLAVESLDALAATNAKSVLPGHGEPWLHGVKSAVEIARQT
jgi:glyoxylase-like metal-dependent hydrolase (beta-lactamase superfamily II)